MKNRKSINFYPKPSMVLLYKFAEEGKSEYAPPEIIKTRPVVVVSRHKRHNETTCTVIPLSLTPPKTVQLWHVLLDGRGMPDNKSGRWAKCDMITNVSLSRLQLFAYQFKGNIEYKHGYLPSDGYKKIIEGLKAHLKIEWP